jgi:Tol biopolymer transport system component
VYVAGADGTQSRQITTFAPGFKSLAWSPQGDALALETDSLQERLYLLELSTGALRDLTPVEGRHLRPAWSPDGTQLAFISNQSPDSRAPTAFDLYLMERDGSNLRRLTQTAPASASWYPWWSADGRHLALGSLSWLSQADLYVVDALGGAVQQVNAPESGAAAPVWSPDGTRLAFEMRLASGQPWRIHIYDLTTGQATLLPASGGDQRRAAWSPDGAQVMYIGNDGPNWDLYQVALTGERPARRLTRDRSIDFSPVWRPATG